MATAFRFADAEDPKAVGMLQRSLSAPVPPQEEGSTFLQAVMAAGGSMSRSVSVSEYNKQRSVSGQSSKAPGSGVVGNISIPSEVDTSLNEDLFFPSVSAAAAITLSPSFGPSSAENGSEFLYGSYLGQGGSTWSMTGKKEEMPSLGLPMSADSSSQHSSSPRSDYQLRLNSTGSNSSSNMAGSLTENGDMYQLRAAMAGMQLGGNQSNGGIPRGGSSQGSMNPSAMYDPNQMQMYYQDGYGSTGMYPGQYMQGGYNRYGGDVYNQGVSGMGAQGGRGNAGMMEQRYGGYNQGAMYGPNTYMNGGMHMVPEYVPQQMRGQGQYMPRGGSGGGNAYMGKSSMKNPQGGTPRTNSQQAQFMMQYGGHQGFGDDAGYNMHNGQTGRSSGGPRASILEDLRMAMRGSAGNNNTQRHRAGMANNTVQAGGLGGGAYSRAPNNLYHQPPSPSSMMQQQSAHHSHGPSASMLPYTLSDVRGHAVEFAQDQFGSRWLQQQLSSTTVTAEEKQALFLELLPAAKELSSDTFGNYCVQILLNPQVGTPEQQLALCKQAFEGNMLLLSRNTYACRCIQSLVKLFQLGDAVIPIALQDKMLHELEKDILSLVTDSNANHVAQQIIERVRPIERISFVLEAFKGKYVTLAKDPYGCRVCQRVLEYASPEYVEPALEELLSDIDDLITDSMGNYVVQHIITASGDRYATQRTRLVTAIKQKLLGFATHKFASNVVEKVLEFGDAKTRREIIQLMLEGHGEQNVPMLQMMMSDLFANYVCQRSLAVAERDQLIRLVAIVRASAHDLRRMTYGKHILSACEKAAAAAGIP